MTDVRTCFVPGQLGANRQGVGSVKQPHKGPFVSPFVCVCVYEWCARKMRRGEAAANDTLIQYR